MSDFLEATKISAGVAKVEITPSPGVEMAGYGATERAPLQPDTGEIMVSELLEMFEKIRNR